MVDLLLVRTSSKAHHPLGNFVAATLETSRDSHEFDYDNDIHENSFEVSSVAATKLPSGCWP